MPCIPRTRPKNSFQCKHIVCTHLPRARPVANCVCICEYPPRRLIRFVNIDRRLLSNYECMNASYIKYESLIDACDRETPTRRAEL